MASPILRLFDSGGVEIAATIAFGEAAPGVPTAEQTFTVRNNDSGATVVDTALGVYLVGTARAAGAVTPFLSSGNAFADAAALQMRVISFSGGATGQTTGFRRSPLRLGDIPDGGQVEIGLRIVTTAEAATSDWEVALAFEVNPWIPLRDAGFEALGNWVYDGRGGGTFPDADFTEVETVAGAFATAGTDTITLPTRVDYHYEGKLATWQPSPATLTFTDVDGDAATLVATEYYWAGLTLDGAGALTVTKGSKATLPAIDADKPTLPADELALVWVVVPFGLAIDTLEQIYEPGFFGQVATGGLNVTIYPGIGASAGYLTRLETPTELTLADASTSVVWALPGNALEVTAGAYGTAYPSERRSLPLWQYTTAGAAITATVDLRVYGPDSDLFPRLVRTTAAAYTVAAGDRVVFANSDAASVVVTLPAGVERRAVRVVNTGTSSNTVSVTPAGAELLLGAASAFVLNDGESLDIVYDPTEGWY